VSVLELDFSVENAERSARAAKPELALTLAVRAKDGGFVHGAMLACQIRIDVVRRGYDEGEAERLFELFGERRDWARTQQSLLWTQTTVLVPAFEDATSVELPLACSLELELAAAKYLSGVRSGNVPLLLLFSGTVFYVGEGERLQAGPIPRTADCRYALSHELYRTTVEHYFADRAPITLQRDLVDRLGRYKLASGAPTLDVALAELLDRAEVSR
jgi:hypothetical protein